MISVLIIAGTCFGTTYYVDDDGANYPGAYSYLQDALAIAVGRACGIFMTFNLKVK